MTMQTGVLSARTTVAGRGQKWVRRLDIDSPSCSPPASSPRGALMGLVTHRGPCPECLV